MSGLGKFLLGIGVGAVGGSAASKWFGEQTHGQQRGECQSDEAVTKARPEDEPKEEI